MSPSPLNGLRVLEHAGSGGAFAGRLLADAGADVVRVVPPVGDPLAAAPPFFGGSDVSIQSTWYNAGKRLVALDLSQAEDRHRFLDLVAATDLLIDDWRAAEPPIDELVLGEHPRLVRVSVTPFGREGPWAGLAANDLVTTALSGAASLSGTPETPPLTAFGDQMQHVAGFYAAIAALAGVRVRDATGLGVHADLSAHEAAFTCTEQLPMQWFFPEGGTWRSPIARRQGSLHWSGGYAVYPDRNGKGIMVTTSLGLVDRLIPWLAEQGAAQDLDDRERYPNLVALVKDMPHLMRVLEEWAAEGDAGEIFLEAQARRLPFGAALDVAEAVRTPQIEARRYFTPTEVPGVGEIPFPGRLFRTSAAEPPLKPPAVADVADVAWARRAPPPATGAARAGTPLAGVRVLDFTHVLAGPFGTRALADLGAEVIKVGTAARNAGANNPGHPYYLSWNRNKRSVTINLASEAGRGVARRLALQCDAVIENFSHGVLARWGLDRASLVDENPGVSVISMGGMGDSGPWRDFVTYAPSIHALTGLTALTRFPAGEHLGLGYSLTDHLSGLAAALATLEALEHRERTGEGLAIDLAQYELGLGLMAPAYLDHLANGTNPGPGGNRHPYGVWAPHGIYPCAGDDRWVAIAVRGDAQWRELCGVMGRDELAADARFATHEARLANQNALDEALAAWTRGQDRYAVMDACQARGIPAGAVQDAADLGERDPQLAARGFFGTVTAEARGEHGVDRFPALFDGMHPAAREGARPLGADTLDVLTRIAGYSEDEVAALMGEDALT